MPKINMNSCELTAQLVTDFAKKMRDGKAMKIAWSLRREH